MPETTTKLKEPIGLENERVKSLAPCGELAHFLSLSVFLIINL